MTHSSCLLLDANVVIHLFKCGAWEPLVARTKLQLARTVIGEARFYFDDGGTRVEIDLDSYVKSGAVEVVDVALAELRTFLALFDPSYAEKLDAGEAESLAYLLAAPPETRICSADAIVFRVLGNLDRGEQGASLEEVLTEVGLARKLPSQFCRKFRLDYNARGVTERLQGTGAKPK
jgi:hypothetical protein